MYCPAASNVNDLLTPKPSFVHVNNTLYKKNEVVCDDCLTVDCVYSGKIKSRVFIYQAPTENFQANSDIIGANIYKSGKDVIIDYEGRYELYRPVK